MNAKHLLKLAEFLETVPRNRFKFDAITWKWKGKQDLSCGAKACAMGWAATMPYFRKMGLRLEKFVTGENELVGEVVVDKAHAGDYLESACYLFDISYGEANFLFTPSPWDSSRLPGTATPKQVAKSIRDFVARKLKEESTNA